MITFYVSLHLKEGNILNISLCTVIWYDIKQLPRCITCLPEYVLQYVLSGVFCRAHLVESRPLSPYVVFHSIGYLRSRKLKLFPQ